METFDVDGRRIHYLTEGSGAPLVFVHGSAGGARQWKRLYEHFARTRRVFAYDLIGCGANRPIMTDAFFGDGCEDVRRFAFEDDARVLGAALELIGRPADVIAHSVGGVGAILAALDRPAAIRTLTLFEPVPFVLLRDNDDTAFAPIRSIATTYCALFPTRGRIVRWKHSSTSGTAAARGSGCPGPCANRCWPDPAACCSNGPSTSMTDRTCTSTICRACARRYCTCPASGPSGR